MITTHDVERILREQGLLCRADKNEEAAPVTWVTCDSREVIPGTLFICKGRSFCRNTCWRLWRMAALPI